MSFVIAAPDFVAAAATDLENIRSTISAAKSAAAASTTALLPAAEDEVSAAIAALFGAHGKAFQALSAQATAFHQEFVQMLNAAAGAYASTEAASISPLQTALQGALDPAAFGRVGLAPLLGGTTSVGSILSGGGLGSILGTGAPVGQGINGFVTALQNGGAASLLSGQIGAVSRGVAGLPTAMYALAPGLLAQAASTGQASIAGPYETLFANTVANLQTLGSAIVANPAPFLHQFLINQIRYAEEIAAGVAYVIQNFPAVLASVPGAIQALLAFNPVPYIQQFIAQQITYAQIIATSLQNAAHDFVVGLQALPAAFQSAVQALMAGNISGAVSDIAQGFLGLFVTGVHITETGDPLIPPGLTISVTPTGTLGDLLPILTIPGMAAQNFTNLLPPGSIPAQISQNVTNVIDTLTDTSISATALLGFQASVSNPITATLTTHIGLPVVLLIDAVGAPVNAANALASTATAFIGDLQTGNAVGAIGTLIDAPAIVTNAFLNGQTTIPLMSPLPDVPPITLIPAIPPFIPATTLGITNGSANLALPLDGLLVGETPITASVTGTTLGTGILAGLNNQPITIPVDVSGTPISGLATGLLVFAPEELALAITPAA